MKRLTVFIAFLFCIFCGVAAAQSTPTVDARQKAQRARIHDGVESGEVTGKEAARLRAEQRHVRRAERRAKADGQVTPAERAKLHRKQNKVSRDIRRQKNDAQDKN